ncbi:MAG TPA: hypothetical protein VKQ11_10765 [Candidatus Sulfotelmatobacter sp.]|nr:hypothetical protein [Candidatus Sulfotelmatobacter sp.]
MLIPGTLLKNILRPLLLALLWPALTYAQDVSTIIQKSAEANKRDWEAVPQYDNYERDRDKDGDRTYSDTMLYGTPYQRLVAINGHPLSAAKQKEEQKKYENEVSKREHESPEERSKRIAKYNEDRKRDQTMLDQMTSAFDFHLIGNRILKGHKVYVLKATPRKGYKPPNRDSQVLTGMQGMLWIDHDTYQWVKVEAHVTHPVRIEGFLAEVEPGTSFELEKQPVADNIWMAQHFSMRANAKVMLLVRHQSAEDDTFFKYRPASGDTPAKESGKQGQSKK